MGIRLDSKNESQGPGRVVGRTFRVVCVFYKWPELDKVVCLDSREGTRWFHCNIVCRYGLPAMVRTDQVQEFSGEFSTYLKTHGILHQHISTQNPCANGQIENDNRTIEATLRKFSVECLGGSWWDFLQDIAQALRLLPVRASDYTTFVLA